jgi:DedD protein
MDQTLKARLIGAAVLVALVVILVPELLSGRRSDPAPVDDAVDTGRRTFTIELGADRAGDEPRPRTQASAPSLAPASTVPATTQRGSDAEVPDPAAPSGPGNVPAATPAPEPAPVVTEVAPVAAPPAAPADGAEQAPPPPAAAASSGGAWVVQAGAFGSDATAQRLVKELESAGYSARVSPVTRSGRTLYRVRVGPAGSRAEADQLAQRLRARGLQPAVVAND